MTAPSTAAESVRTQQHTVVIAASADRTWHALTDAAESARWYFGTGVASSWQPGAAYTYRYPDGTVAIEGTVERIEPPHLLVMTFSARWDDATSADPESRVTWQIEPEGDLCRVTVRHEGMPVGSATEQQTGSGWPYLLSNLKTLLETGTPLRSSPS